MKPYMCIDQRVTQAPDCCILLPARSLATHPKRSTKTPARGVRMDMLNFSGDPHPKSSISVSPTVLPLA